MAKPVYFYGMHACTALLQHRPLDVLTVFIQQPSNEKKPVTAHKALAGQKAVEQDGKDSLNSNDSQLTALFADANTYGISVQHASKDKLTKLCNSPQHQGVVVHARPLNFTPEDALTSITTKNNCLLLVLDRITDAHNFGACIRSAVAMGVDAVICPKKHAAPLTPTVAKVAVGTAEMLPIIAVTNLARCLKQIKDAGVFVYGTALDDTAKPLQHCDLTQKTALVMGSEGEGMRRLTADSCDQLVYIPMIGDVQSLNVSVATGMVLYEASRQRL